MLSTSSIIVAIASVIAMILVLLVGAPFLFDPKLRQDFPNNIVGTLAIVGFFVAVGFIVGIPHDYDPSKYEDRPLCHAQWVFLGVMGQATLLLLFSYVLALWLIVVRGKRAKNIVWKQRLVGPAIVACSAILNLGLPYAFPFTYSSGPREGETIAIGAQGPWCGTKSLLPFTILFYGPIIPTAILSIIMAVQIIYVVYRTTSKANMLSGSGGEFSDSTTNPKGKSSYGKRMKRKFQRFYARVAIFSSLYCVLSLAAFLRRVLELLDQDRDPNAPNDPTFGTSMMLPFLAVGEGLVLLSMPAVTSFYRNRVFKGIIPPSTSNQSRSGTTGNDEPRSVGSPTAIISGSPFDVEYSMAGLRESVAE